MSVQGLKRVTAAINTHRAGGLKGLRKGLFTAGLFLQRESQKIVPIEFAVLKNSANTRPEGTGAKTSVVVSYGTDYAVFVHEDLEARHKPGKQAKFLEQPLRDHRERIREIVVEGIIEGMH